MSSEISAARLAERLRQGRNSDGGWGYYNGKASRLEPTAWAAIALSALGDETAAATLGTWPLHEGLLVERPGGGPNYGFHGLALLAMHASRIDHATGTSSLLAGLQRVKGVKVDSSTVTGHQDNSLQAWSWIDETFTWVEPTAWCTLCLKKWLGTPGTHVDGARLYEAERVLINRTCADGGWNYGNADVLGKHLRPYVPNSALALLAIQDRRDLDVVARSLGYLERHAVSEPSAMALSMASIALRVYGRPDADVRAALLAQLPVTMDLGNHAAMAMAAYALHQGQDYAAFTL